jgi:hypothetical protein
MYTWKGIILYMESTITAISNTMQHKPGTKAEIKILELTQQYCRLVMLTESTPTLSC